LGALDDAASADAARVVYDRIAADAVGGGVVVDVVSISDDTADLETIGRVAATTGGEVLKVDALGLQGCLQALATPPIATAVRARIFVHSAVTLRDDAGGVVVEHTREIGNVSAESRVTFQFSVADEVELPPTLPFQIQIEYTRSSGEKRLRVVSRAQKVTRDSEVSRAGLNHDVMAAHTVQSSSRLAQQGLEGGGGADCDREVWGGSVEYVFELGCDVEHAVVAYECADGGADGWCGCWPGVG
jgi:hypothetical protein